ncbi:hypothetical protein V2I01_10680 [Micromonospora sp. BRA006-A]|nr:hypothetical protein [Micromonospora sp. BRA006-A]
MIGEKTSTTTKRDVIATFHSTAHADDTLDTTDRFHAIRWATGLYHWTVPETGLVSIQATIDLRGLRRDDLVRIRAEYTRPETRRTTPRCCGRSGCRSTRRPPAGCSW